MWEYGIVHLIIVLTAYLSFGWLYGTIALIVFVYCADLVLMKCGYTRLTYGDLCMSYELPNGNHNAGGYFIIEKLDFKTMEHEIYNRAIKNIPKLHTILVRRFGLSFWKHIDMELAKKQVIQVKQKMNTEKECLKYVETILNEHMDRDKPLWEMRLLEDYDEKHSVIFVRLHHAITDGGGYVSLMSCINDDKYKFKSNKTFPKPNIFVDFVMTIICPFHTIFFLAQYSFLKSSPDARKIGELKGPDTHKNKYYVSEEIDFDAVRKCYKRFEKTSFNDYIMGIITISMNEWFKNYGHMKAEKILSCITVNLRGMPDSMQDLILDNKSGAVKFELPIKENLEDGIKACRKSFRRFFTNWIMVSFSKFCSAIQFFPQKLIMYILQNFYSSIDLMYSNVPFPSEGWHFCNKKAVSIKTFANIQHNWKYFFIVTTFRGKIALSSVANENLKMDPQKLIDIAIRNLKEEIATHAKSD